MNFEYIYKSLEGKKLKTEKGGEYWMAREIQGVLAYSRWEDFEGLIEKAKKACKISGIDVEDNFRETPKVIEKSNGVETSMKDYYLTRYACYLITMSGDTSKPEIAFSQTYFAVKARLQEVQDQLTDQQKRLKLRQRVKDANTSLNATAKNVGVQRYGLFHDAGYRGLYEMGLADIKRKKGLDVKEDLLDRAGRAELAANEFRITQTEQTIVQDGVKDEKGAIDTHHKVGKEVRETIKRLKNPMPEDLIAEPSIEKLVKMEAKEKKKSLKKPEKS